MRRFVLALCAALTAALALPLAQAPAGKPLDVYVIDPEGGKSALWVTPAGQAILIDTGSPGGRDVARIMEAVNAAGVKQIDYLIATHYHSDHIGGLQELATRIPIRTYVDHGPSAEPREQVEGFTAAYAELYGKARHLVVKPGDRLPLTGVDWRIVTAAGEALKTPIAGAPGAGAPNPACAATRVKEQTDDENAMSIGSVVAMGKFRAADFGDLLWKKEVALMCPNNPIGTVDLFMVTHHGLDLSNAPALVHALRPRVAIMQNGTTKGAAIEVMQTLHSSPGLQDVWQLHWSYTAGIEYNQPGLFIANLEDPAVLGARLAAPPEAGRGRRGGGTPPAPHVPAYWIKVSAWPDGSFAVTNTRNGFSKTYGKP
jgi:beta-lactamase superfamily II metal-dependent hydrolase